MCCDDTCVWKKSQAGWPHHAIRADIVRDVTCFSGVVFVGWKMAEQTHSGREPHEWWPRSSRLTQSSRKPTAWMVKLKQFLTTVLHEELKTSSLTMFLFVISTNFTMTVFLTKISLYYRHRSLTWWGNFLMRLQPNQS